jgi:hypothetical protein
MDNSKFAKRWIKELILDLEAHKVETRLASKRADDNHAALMKEKTDRQYQRNAESMTRNALSSLINMITLADVSPPNSTNVRGQLLKEAMLIKKEFDL